MMVFSFFDRYVKRCILQEHMEFYIKRLRTDDRDRLSNLIDDAECNALYLLDPSNKLAQQEYEQHLKNLLLTTLKLSCENNSTLDAQDKYTTFIDKIASDYTLDVAINKHLSL
jgi:hypothetical protein